LSDWRGLLQRNVPEARALLRTLLVGPLTFTPVDDGERGGYTFRGTIALDRLLERVVDLPTKTPAEEASPTGVVQEWTRPVPGEVPAGSGSGRAA